MSACTNKVWSCQPTAGKPVKDGRAPVHGARLTVANIGFQLRRQSVRIGATYVLLVTSCGQWLCSMTPINYVVYIHEWESICDLWSLIATFFRK